ncbi:MAG TPA: hypothetical protein VK191_02275, partial [Symbiobacteriaceae bacterium]|nr:hypothetical protein [Symbiobacteriaceae bacterium]
GQAEQAAGRAGQFLQGAQAKLAEQAFVQQAAAKLDQIAIPGLQSSTGTTTRDYIWSGIALLITVLGVWSAPFLHLILALVVGAVAVLLGVRTGVNPVWRALAFTLTGGLVAFALPADPILLTGIALSARGAWGIVKELFPAEGPRLQGLRAKYLWSGLGIATLGLCFQWTRRESSSWVSFSTLTRSNEYSPGTNLYGLGQKMTTHTSTWGGESAAGYIFFLIGLSLLLYFTQGKRWTFGWQVGLTLLVWPLALVWMQGFTSYLGLGLIIYSIGIAVALRGLLGDRMPWPKRFR